MNAQVSTLDWNEVAAARRRGKLGRMKPGDQDLVERAMREDLQRYINLSKQVVEEIYDDIMKGKIIP